MYFLTIFAATGSHFLALTKTHTIFSISKILIVFLLNEFYNSN